MEGISANDAIAKLFVKFGEAIVDKAQWTMHKQSMSKIATQREAEYQKSMLRHAEFPAVPELQAKFRNKELKMVQEIDENLAKATRREEAAAEGMASQLLEKLPLAEIKTRLDDSSAQDQRISKEYETRLASLEKTREGSDDKFTSLEKKLESFRDEWVQEQKKHQDELETNREAAFKAQCADIKTQLEQQELNQKKANIKIENEFLDQLRRMRQDFETQQANAMKHFQEEVRLVRQKLETQQEEQIKKIRQDFEAQQASAVKQQKELQSILAKQETVIKELREKQQQQPVNIPDPKLASDLAALKQELAVLQSRYSSQITALQNENKELKAQLSTTLPKVDDVATVVGTQKNEITSLRESVAACSKQLEDQGQTLQKETEKLQEFDAESLAQLADLALEFPQLKQTLNTLSRKVEEQAQKQTRQSTPAGQVPVSRTSASPAPASVAGWEDPLPKIATMLDVVMKQAGKLVDDLKKDVEALTGRVDALEESQVLDDLVSELASLRDRIDGLENQTFNNEELDGFRATVKRLDEDISSSKVQLEEVDKAIKTVNEELPKTTKFLNHQISTLDSQVNNLSTRSLADHIIAHIGNIYPEQRQLVADITMLNSQMVDLKSKFDKLLDGIGSVREAGKCLDEQEKEELMILAQISQQPSVGQKRRRLDSNPASDPPLPQPNGHGLPKS